ncbi:aromatic acid exporter family protein [Rubrobacter taiwanensis]|uniref:Aromatic acid exporter family protein n=1 Tax=Rubrobacter taiwanensis TaxID=185139 RepID=A0A4R1BI51_9ACTN|nr:FUSC family protein [Rubrobacter taiwanensis]TCJ16828.1 aromatic acid exporter family protein [Rubrobacter taiwanensis]
MSLGRFSGGVRRRLSAGVDRLRASGWLVIQATLAASAAYFLAVFLLGHERPFFAPIAAVVTLSVTLGRRGRRAVEIAFGVAVGLMVADLIVLAIGTGAAQIGLVVLLAMAAAVFVGGGPLLVNQAAISALLVVVLENPEDGLAFDRFFDALVGGGVALAVNYLFPVNPERLVERAARPVFDELGAVLEEVAAALESSDRERAEQALARARRIDERVRNFGEALAAGHDTARISPTRRRALRHLELYATAGSRIDLTVINGRVLARGAANAVRRGERVPSVVPEAVRDLARAVTALAAYLEETEGPAEARRYALKAARGASRALKEPHNLAVSVLVGHVRSAAVDILRSTGMDQSASVQAVEEAAGRATEIG